jgi:hypothetical protein
VNRPNPDDKDVRLFREWLDTIASGSLLKANESAAQFIDAYTTAVAQTRAGQELLKREIKRKREAMSYDDAPPILKILIHRVIMTEIRLDHVEASYARHMNNNMQVSTQLKKERIISMLQNRLLKAVNSMALLKRTLAEADYYDAKSAKARKSSTLSSVNLYKAMSK